MNVNYCGANFIIYTNIESLCCTPETNTMLYVNYTSTFKKKVKKKEMTQGVLQAEMEGH